MLKSKFRTEKLCNRCNIKKGKNDFRIIKSGVGGLQDDEKLFETWFVNNSISFEELRYNEWKEFNL